MKLKDQLLAVFKTLGVDLGEKAKDVEKALDELDKTPPTSPPPPSKEGVDEGLRAEIAGMQQQMKDLLGAMAEEKKQRMDAQKTLSEKLAADQAKRVDDAITKHEKAGQIVPALKEHFKKILQADYDTGIKIIEALPVDPAAKKAAGAADGGKKGGEGDKTTDTPASGLERMVPSAMMKGIRELTTTPNN